MDADAKVEKHVDALPAFNPAEHQSVRMGLTSQASDPRFDQKVWDAAKPMVQPMVWSWYDSHKEQRVAKIGGFYTVTVGSFGIAEMVITAIFGSRDN